MGDSGLWKAVGEGKLMAVIPGTDLSDAIMDEPEKLGTVVALVSPGAFHNMGLAAWKAR